MDVHQAPRIDHVIYFMSCLQYFGTFGVGGVIVCGCMRVGGVHACVWGVCSGLW